LQGHNQATKKRARRARRATEDLFIAESQSLEICALPEIDRR
jgi:hypothetical protein